MTPADTLEDYRSAFWQTFAEDHGLVTEWQIDPPKSFAPPDIKIGMIPSGFLIGVGLPN